MNIENNHQNAGNKKLEITSNDILQCLMHAATREDIAELRAENKANIGDLRKELKIDMAELRTELKAEMQSLRKDTNKYFSWLVGLMFGSFGGIALMILKFPMLTH